MAISRRSILMLGLTLLPGCRYTLDTAHPVPAVARTVVDDLLRAGADTRAAQRLGSAHLAPEDARRLAADWVLLVEPYTRLTAGRSHVVVSHGVTNANVDVLGDGEPVGRLRVVVSVDGQVVRIDVLRAWPDTAGQ